MSEARSQSKSTGDRIRQLVDRTIQRNINGVSYFVTPDPPVGLTAKDIIHKRGTLQLFHYHPMTDEVYRTPILIVTPTTNRSYALDMMPGVSLVEFLLKSGYDVYLMDWQPPRPEEKSLSLQDYSQTFIQECLDIVLRETGEDEVTLMGYCMGGVLASIYTASMKNRGVRNLVCFTTPVDFREMGMFTRTTDKKHFDVDRMVDLIGNVPPGFVLQGFMMTEPGSKPASRAQLWKNMWDTGFVENFRKYDRWANDMLPLAGEYFRETIKQLMWDNALYTGKLKVGGNSANLKNITVPIFHAQAQHDSLVLPEASKPLIPLVGSEDKTEIVLKGGHVSLVCGANAVGRLWPVLDDWLSERSA
ncbi:MAG: alpha/beta fold hydrolase [Hyphomonas sp.]|nr:alpha/beta fold hydrolase [Hyphomonas sp.]